MREFLLLKRINQTYRRLNLGYLQLLLALFMMGLTSVFEMLGLSIIYPLVSLLGGRSNHFFAPSMLQHVSEKNQMLLLFSSVAVIYLIKNIVLCYTYHNNINFAIRFHKSLIRALYHAYIYKPLLEFRQESAGSLANVICAQSEKLVDGVIRPLLVAVTEACILVGISVLLLFINVGLILTVLFTCTLAAMGFYAFFRKKALQWGINQVEGSTLLNELVNNTSIGISEIKLFRIEDYLTQRVYMAAEKKTRMFHRLEMYQQSPRYIIETVFIVTVITYFCAQLFFGQSASVLLAQFSVIAAASFRILPSINRLVGSYSTFSFNSGQALLMLETITHVQAESGEAANAASHASFDAIPTSTTIRPLSVETIVLDHAEFQYPLAPALSLKQVSLSISKGMRVGIVGSSGSGKSTLVKLLTGLYPPTQGLVLVDGLDVTNILRSWHAVIAYVPQESFIMPGTIRENIAFTADHAAVVDQDIWFYLDQVGLRDFILSFPSGLDTLIGEKGVALSGGQKQLICMARALYRKPKVFILDEPTASLDALNEQRVLDIIHALAPTITVIMISHRRTHFKAFDVVYACDAGRLVLKEPNAMEVV